MVVAGERGRIDIDRVCDGLAQAVSSENHVEKCPNEGGSRGVCGVVCCVVWDLEDEKPTCGTGCVFLLKYFTTLSGGCHQ